jgi:hypothetical protein
MIWLCLGAAQRLFGGSTALVWGQHSACLGAAQRLFGGSTALDSSIVFLPFVFGLCAARRSKSNIRPMQRFTDFPKIEDPSQRMT